MAHNSWSDDESPKIPTVRHVGEQSVCQAPICRAYYAGLREGWDIRDKNLKVEDG